MSNRQKWGERMKLADLTDYLTRKYGIEIEFISNQSRSLAALIAPGASESFGLLFKEKGDEAEEAMELKLGSLARFFASRPAFSQSQFMQDPGWVRVDLTSPDLDEAFLYKTIDSAFQAGRPVKRAPRSEKVHEQENIVLLPETGEKSQLEEKEYQAEKIPARADFIQASDHNRLQEKNEIPARIKQMQEAYDYQAPAAKRREINFYRQGQLMADYEDDVAYHGTVVKTGPVYHDLTPKQLRGYFTWRTQFRKGEAGGGQEAYYYLLESELVCQIGVKNKEEGLKQLNRLFEQMAKKSNLITSWQQKHLLQNYMVYYAFPQAEIEKLFTSEIKRGENYQVLLQKDTPGLEMYQALCSLSPYQPKANPLLKKEPEKFYRALELVWQALREGPYDLLETMVGQKLTVPLTLFNEVTFYSPNPVQDAEIALPGGISYLCQGGQWQVSQYWPSQQQRRLLPAFVHEFDRLLRDALHLGRKLKEKKVPPAYLEALKKGINAFLAEQKEASRPKIDLDLSKLGQIRADASVTRDNLLTEEEKELEAEEAKKIAEKENPVQKTEEEDKEMASPQAENDYGLSPLEVSFLLDLVKGEDYQTLLKQNHLFLSVLVDGINDKLFDEIGDTVIDSDGDSAEIIEDYRPDLLEILGIEEA
ncbi:TerB N-terminal domain-containing protein [Lactobacillus equicursoris]|uniref:TerB N-terminal domain-containing protein n=1 Tax=Lactobacillus equicursoris TaxID=420645 RepID=UPI00242FD0CC|nr:TerB N-terminal domain-containing protein [Lactobacillus equicursoris]